MNRKLIITIVLIVSALAVFKLRPTDAGVDISRMEKAVLSVLRSRGVADRHVFLREEDKWKRSRVRGKSLNYVFKLDNAVKGADLSGEIRESLKDIKGADLSKVYYRSDGGKGTGTAYLEMTHNGIVVLALTLDNVLPDWVKSGKEDVKSSRKSKKEPIKHPVVALVLDDFGYTKRNLKALRAIDAPLTVAILPNVPHSTTVDSFASENQVEVILHLPMEPEGGRATLEKDTVMVDMEGDEVKDIISRALRTVPSARGVSNHQGSRATKDERIMAIVIEEIKKRGLFFLDSLTTKDSVCGQVAEREGLPYVKRDLFLDMGSDEEYVKQQLEKAEKLARLKGRAVVIGHDKPATLKVLREVIPGMKDRGVEFVTLSKIVELDSREEAAGSE